MKKSTLILIGVIAVIVIYVIFAYNGLVSKQEQLRSKWSQVETQYQRRSDLIPNLVATVKGYAKHESNTLREVMEARSKATQININPDKLDAESIAQYNKAQGELSQALGRLLMITENYPDLKASEQFTSLQAELSGCENRIAVARDRYNDAAKKYNISRRRFPNNLFASAFGFSEVAYFKADEGSEKAPKVSF
ncbi:LemA family protein [Capnocytophaga sputigena]|jgi:lemA protein|uniref:LemA family protein n=1 Tax=Capnocytophaga sputigena TaxID=1019 RepID=UPI00288BF912|nr:LemA family protein [Capnocytophaga sputigena]